MANSIVVNIYADEIQLIACPYTQEEWFYIGIVVEDISNPLLDDIISERFLNNFDKESPYYSKNNREIHWSKLRDADAYHICKRWFKYILDVGKSGRKFYAYILGINNSKLNREEFGGDNFTNRYNKFFRSAILYALKTFFPGRKIIVDHVFHEVGQQQNHDYFPWHSIFKIGSSEKDISFNRDTIEFLPKDNKRDRRSNLIQLCDAFMGAAVTIIHGLPRSNKSNYKEKLCRLIFPLIERMINNPKNVNSSYEYANRIMIRFFPRQKTVQNDLRRMTNQFFTKRNLSFADQISGQLSLF